MLDSWSDFSPLLLGHEETLVVSLAVNSENLGHRVRVVTNRIGVA